MSKGRAFIVDDEPSGLNSHRDDRLGVAFTVTATDVKNEFGRVLEKGDSGRHSRHH
jgi:hypothetical protein